MSFNGESLSFTTYLMLVFACGASVTVMHYYNKTLAIPHCSVQDATYSNPVKQLMLDRVSSSCLTGAQGPGLKGRGSRAGAQWAPALEPLSEAFTGPSTTE